MDTHVYTGYHIPPHYDSLLAKLIVSGNTREEALIRAQHSLDSFVVEGVSTTIGILSRITRDPHFVSGEVDTGFVARFLAAQKESE
jgi:acetyl-CoA carboxylase biotin carboxylase subunit